MLFSIMDSRELRLEGLSARRAAEISSQTGVSLRQVEHYALSVGAVPRRYSRNIGTFDFDGQMKLLESQVLVVGLGGLGGHVAEGLARAGVGRIVAADPDVFEEDNLNRQLLSSMEALGQPKADWARRRLAEVNPAVEFVGFAGRFQDLADEIFADARVVFDCLDTVPARLELEARCSAVGVPLVHGAIGGWFGQVGIVWPGSGLLTRICRRQSRGIEGQLGNPPFTPAVAAGLMVARGIRVLLNKVKPGQACLQFFDLLDDEWEDIKL